MGFAQLSTEPKACERLAEKKQAVKTIPHIELGQESHFGIEYRKTPLPADLSACL